MTEQKIVSRLQKGDSNALSWVMDKYTPYLYAVAASILGSTAAAEDIEDIVSESFVSLWYSCHKIKSGKLKPYLAVITRNKALSRLRAQHIYEALEDDTAVLDCREPEYEILCAELESIAKIAVDSLPEPDREIFKRHYFLYQKTEFIAAALGLKAATVRTKLARGRKRLQNYLTERGYDCENLFD